MRQGINVGYCKPVGQKFLDLQNKIVDKDAVLFADLINMDLDPSIHSPVILGKGATSKFMESPDAFNLAPNIIDATALLNETHELVIFEGTGHPGVGSIANLSNARVAKLIGAGVIMIVEGGIGSTIDMMNMCLALFREEEVPIIGVIINKVLPEKRDKVERYVGKWLKRNNLNLLGVLPYDKSLAHPILASIVYAVKGEVEMNKDKLQNKVENILAGSLIDLTELKENQNQLLVVSVRLISNAINRIQVLSKIFNIKECPLSGIVLTGKGEIEDHVKDYINKNKLPLIRTTSLDTYGSVLKISRIEVKINRSTPWKINRAIELISQNVHLEGLLTPIT
jgi:dethiobiotin synthetase